MNLMIFITHLGHLLPGVCPTLILTSAVTCSAASYICIESNKNKKFNHLGGRAVAAARLRLHFFYMMA